MTPTVKVASTLPMRDFIWTLVRTDFKARYHGALGGFVWALFKPLAMFIVLHQVFSFLFRDKTYMLNLLIGLLLWNFFGEGSSTGLESLQRKGFLLTKAKFPRWIVVLTSSANSLLTLVVYSLAIVAVISFSRGVPSALSLLLFLFYLVQYFLIVLGFSLGTSVLFLKYRDLNQIWDVALQAGFFVAPIMYPLDIIPERYHFYLYLWPVTPVIQFSRSVLVKGVVPSFTAHLLLLCVTVVMFGLGAAIFRNNAASAVEKL